MKIIHCASAFGNLVFQYIFFKYIQDFSNDGCCLLDNPYEYCGDNFSVNPLERMFGIQAPSIKSICDKSTYEEITQICFTDKIIPLPDLLSRCCIGDFKIVAEMSRYKIHTDRFQYKSDNKNIITKLPVGTYDSSLCGINGDVFYFGLWFNPMYFQQIKKKILSELVFVPIADDYNKRMAEAVAMPNAVAIHIRQGDYIRLGWALKPEYYYDAIQKMREKVINPIWFIFSNDLKYCETHLSKLGFRATDKIIFADGNSGPDEFGSTDFRDAQLMSLCKNMILSNSSFSYASALLNQNSDKFVITPNDFMKII